MYRHAVGPLLSCLAVLALNMLWVCQYSSCALRNQNYRKPFNSQHYSFGVHDVLRLHFSL